jgi:hypothetical protein
MLQYLQDQLIAMNARDVQVRAELEADGSLFEGYHVRMEEVHRANAHQLRVIIEEYGWPDEELVGQEGAEAAWLIAQHSIAEPTFMRLCRGLLDVASQTDRVPRWQFAYIDDRIRVFEGKPQRFGTQHDLKPDGVVVSTLEDSAQVDTWRREVGLATISEAISRVQGGSLPSLEEYLTKQAEGNLWRRKVGWTP